MANFNGANALWLSDLQTAYQEAGAMSHFDADVAVVRQLDSRLQPLALVHLRVVVLGMPHYSADEVEHAQNMLIVFTHRLAPAST